MQEGCHSGRYFCMWNTQGRQQAGVSLQSPQPFTKVHLWGVGSQDSSLSFSPSYVRCLLWLLLEYLACQFLPPVLSLKEVACSLHSEQNVGVQWTLVDVQHRGFQALGAGSFSQGAWWWESQVSEVSKCLHFTLSPVFTFIHWKQQKSEATVFQAETCSL